MDCFLAGCFAGFWCYFATYPFDLVKSWIQGDSMTGPFKYNFGQSYWILR